MPWTFGFNVRLSNLASSLSRCKESQKSNQPKKGEIAQLNEKQKQKWHLLCKKHPYFFNFQKIFKKAFYVKHINFQ